MSTIAAPTAIPVREADAAHAATAPAVSGIRIVVAFTLILVAITWSAILWTISLEYDYTLRTTIKANANLARAFEEHVVRTLRQVDQVALFVKDQYEKHGADIDLQRYTAEGRIAGEIYNQVGVIDENGTYIMSNLPGFKRMHLGDREHFRAHVDRDTGEIFVGKPVLGRASGKWSIQLTRRINKPDGSFGGVVVISVDPFYFSTFYSQVDLGRNGVAMLAGRDGVVRARQSGEDKQVGQDLGGSTLFEHIAAESVGDYVSVSAIDGIRRVLGYRAMSAYPLVVVVGSGYDEAFEEFYARRNGYLLAGGVFTAAILAFCFAVITLIRRKLRINAELRAAMQRAESANRMKSEFLASMSHELRTPLNGILGFSELLQEEVADDEQREHARLINASGRHLLQLVNAILDLAKIEAGRMDCHSEPVRLRPMLEEVIRVHAGTAEQKGIACRLEADGALPATFVCDRTKVIQVLNNLLHNAVKFTGRGEVVLAVRAEGDALRFEVRDTGPGISPDKQATIFERFVQGENFLTRQYGGAGLGLALARELVELMGGRIGLHSVPGEGATFDFTLPLQPAPKEPA